jgi:hypothetical protein
MTGLKDLLKKKDRIGQEAQRTQPGDNSALEVPQFTFVRTTTESEEVIEPPSFPGDEGPPGKSKKSDEKERRHIHLGFRKSSNASVTKDPTAEETHEKSPKQLPVRIKGERRLSQRFHLHRDRSRSASGESSNLPEDLPEAPEAVTPIAGQDGSAEEAKELKEQREAQWEKRATLLAQSNPFLEEQQKQQEKARARSKSPSISDKCGDGNIQEAIRLHEAGDLERSTAMFGRLADPRGVNNALAQVLYGLGQYCRCNYSELC